jgi:hypothetical protein
MKKKIVFGFILISLLQLSIQSQSQQFSIDTSLAYYPLNIGNKWVFKETITTTIPPIEIIIRDWSLEIIKDTLLSNNKIYKKEVNIIYGTSPYYSISYERIDSSESKVFQFDQGADSTEFEKLILDFTKQVGDTIFSPYWTIVFENAGSKAYFNQIFNFREYSHTFGLIGYGDHYLQNIGLYKYTWAADFVSSVSNLRGCLVGGNLYGDTTTVSVENENVNPSDFYLYQNYPNPFNPTTKIKYSIPSVTLRQAQSDNNVTLKVYDVLGTEITTLVNEQKQPGTYEVEFEGTNLASGIYFYQLKAGTFIETKKMILLR